MKGRTASSLLLLLSLIISLEVFRVSSLDSRNVSINEEESLQLNEEMEDTIGYEGETTDLQCEITGSPLPSYRWFKNDILIDKGMFRLSSKPNLWGSTLRIKNLHVKDGGLYKCVGLNGIKEISTDGYLTVITGPNPNKSKTKLEHDLDTDSSSIDPDVDIKPIYPEIPNKQHYDLEPTKKQRNSNNNLEDGDIKRADDQIGFCQPYVGNACSRYLNNQSIFSIDNDYQFMHEEWIRGHLSTLEKLDEISIQCKQFLVPILCLTTFSTCHQADVESNRKPAMKSSRTKKLCKEECDLVRSVHCKDEYSDASLNRWSVQPANIIEKFKYENIYKILNIANCKDLKATQNSGSCNSAAIPSISPYDDSKCYMEDGHAYRGVAHKTKGNVICLRWSDVGNFYESGQTGSYPIDHNLCRNPDRSMAGPWCFVEAEVGHTKEMCAIDPCDRHVKSSYQNSLLIGILCAILIIVIVTVTICTRMRREAGNRNRKLIVDNKSDQQQQQHKNNNVQLKSLLDRQSFQSTGSPPYLAPGNVSLNYELFQQSYGKIYRGEILAYCGPTDGPVVPAIFRTLDPNSSPKLQVEFWKDIDKVSDYHHPNITAILGINKTSQPNFVAYEASSYGDLNEYLKSNSEVVKCQPSENFVVTRASILPDAVLVSIAVQVASALEFLHSKNFIHNELNSYNVIVCENGVVKISMVTPGGGPNYFMVSQGRPIPLRWSPHEVITSLIFSDKSDVWSFGIILWEIYSCASLPYGPLSDVEVVEAIKSFRILPCPPHCPSNVYTLMVQCWHKVPANRPTAGELHDQLRQLWTELNKAPSMGSNHSHSNTNHSNSCDNHQPLLHQLSTSHQATPTRLLSSHSSSTSQKSSPASSSCNYKQTPFNDFGGSVGKKRFFGNEIYTEQIV